MWNRRRSKLYMVVAVAALAAPPLVVEREGRVVEGEQEECTDQRAERRDDAQHQRAAPKPLDVAPIGQRRGDVAGKLRHRRGGVGDNGRHADQGHGAEGQERPAAGNRVGGAARTDAQSGRTAPTD